MRNSAVTACSHVSKPALLNPVAVKCRGPASVTDKVPVTHSGRVRLCRGHSFRGVWGHGEWIAYLLHQWFSRCRGLMGREDSQALKEDTVSDFFGGEKGNNYCFVLGFFCCRLVFYFFLGSGPVDRRDASRELPENVLVYGQQNKKSLNYVTELKWVIKTVIIFCTVSTRVGLDIPVQLSKIFSQTFVFCFVFLHLATSPQEKPWSQRSLFVFFHGVLSPCQSF